jgi:hypothetical protein
MIASIRLGKAIVDVVSTVDASFGKLLNDLLMDLILCIQEANEVSIGRAASPSPVWRAIHLTGTRDRTALARWVGHQSPRRAKADGNRPR